MFSAAAATMNKTGGRGGGVGGGGSGSSSGSGSSGGGFRPGSSARRTNGGVGAGKPSSGGGGSARKATTVIASGGGESNHSSDDGSFHGGGGGGGRTGTTGGGCGGSSSSNHSYGEHKTGSGKNDDEHRRLRRRRSGSASCDSSNGSDHRRSSVGTGGSDHRRGTSSSSVGRGGGGGSDHRRTVGVGGGVGGVGGRGGGSGHRRTPVGSSGGTGSDHRRVGGGVGSGGGSDHRGRTVGSDHRGRAVGGSSSSDHRRSGVTGAGGVGGGSGGGSSNHNRRDGGGSSHSKRPSGGGGGGGGHATACAVGGSNSHHHHHQQQQHQQRSKSKSKSKSKPLHLRRSTSASRASHPAASRTGSYARSQSSRSLTFQPEHDPCMQQQQAPPPLPQHQHHHQHQHQYRHHQQQQISMHHSFHHDDDDFDLGLVRPLSLSLPSSPASAASTASPSASGVGGGNNGGGSNRIYFLQALASIPVPDRLLKGVPVLKVAASGATEEMFLMISEDKFTLYINKTQSDGSSRQQPSARRSFMSFGSSSSSAAAAADDKNRTAIDIGEMERIQRGQSTQQFEKAKKNVDRLQNSSSSISTAASFLRRSELARNSSSASATGGAGVVVGGGVGGGSSGGGGGVIVGSGAAAAAGGFGVVSSGMVGSGGGAVHAAGGGGGALPSSFTTNGGGVGSFCSGIGGGGGPSSASSAAAPSATGTTTATATTAAQIQQLDPKRSFSIVFRGARTLDLMTMTVQDRKEICDVLDRILLSYQRGKTRVANDVLLLRYIWLDVDRDKTGYINSTKFGQVLQQINFYMKQRDVQANYDKFGKVIGLDRFQRRRGLTFEQSATFLHKIKRDSWMVKPVNVIWNELFGEIMNNGKMRTTVSDKTFLDKFLHRKQGQSAATIVDVRKLFRRLHDMEIAHHSAQQGTYSNGAEPVDLNRINKDQFEAYLLAAENDAFDPDRERFSAADMNQPLSEYWINSSHNTYLIGDQYTSHSSVEMYSAALYRGCRCLELDCWDGGRHERTGLPVPVVWHGHTMTTKIRFVDIIKTIKVFLNFHPDTYPIILSFENHCSVPYQDVMADQLVKVLGDSLYVPTESSLIGPLPSPEQLKGMVVIKGRRPDGTEAEQYDSDDMEEDDMSDGEYDGATVSTMTTEATTAVYGQGQQQQQQHQVQKAYRQSLIQKNKHGVSAQLARLTLLHGTKHVDWESSCRSPRHHMHSFSESKVRRHCRSGAGTSASAAWARYNREHLSRTYPAGSRVDSSNYNPLLAWSAGCQMVALNFQTQDAFLKINDGRFRQNGNCGYVHKPATLLYPGGAGASFTLLAGDANRGDETYETVQNTASVKLTVRVLSGSCLPKHAGQRAGDCIDPYVRVDVYDVKKDDRERDRAAVHSHVTAAAGSNGFFPIWSCEKFSFLVENWSVAVLQLTVLDNKRGGGKDEFVASCSIPTSCIRRGIRSVKLYEETNTRSGAFDFASLLLDVKIAQVVAEI